jgi:hypothetical protein
MTETIALGGRRFEVRPLKLGQLRHLLDALEAMTGKSGGGLIEAAAMVVAAGLQPAHPGLDADAVLDLEAGIDELNAAVAAILRTAGLHPKEVGPKEIGQGEAPPVAGPGPSPGNSSAPSTAPSPPAAAMPMERST